MKLIFAISILTSTLSNINAQDSSQTLRRLTADEATNLEIAKNFTNGDEIDEYVLPDGSVIKKGSKLLLGKPINNSKTYTRIYFGYYSLGKALLVTPQTLPDAWAGSTVVVDKLKVSHQKMTVNSALNIFAYVQDPNMSTALGANNRTILGLDMAISTGEVINPNATISREAAIAKLKEGKDLMDLGLMSKEDYDKLKEQLTPIITGSK
jgi:hypothetical protein